LAAVVAYSGYITRQISGLRDLQNNLVDRNRKDSLQLLRIQNDLNSLALAMRDMLDNDEPYPLTAWSAQFQRVRNDLDDALHREQQVAPVNRTPDQERYLENSVAQFWDAADRTFALAQDPNQTEARTQIRISLRARQESLSTAVSRLLVQNNESEEQAALRIQEIYNRVQRQVYIFLTATLTAILLTSLYLIRSNRRLFAQLATLSEQRSELAQKLIATQESTLRHISRELHDEFGQILTAVGAMLTRAGKHAPEDSPLRAELREVCEITQSTLDKVRSLSQALHPVMLEETGLESTLDWYLPVVERQAGIHVSYEKSGEPFPVAGNAAIHVYRVVQEALNNLTRHSGSTKAWVRLRFSPQDLQVEIEDHGKGFEPRASSQGIGLVAMRERAELLGGRVEFLRPMPGEGGKGTLVRLQVPREKLDSHAG
jgi:signal transduction histidine kinase